MNIPSTFRFPMTSLCARPSAIAVFPTPGSPGLKLYQPSLISFHVKAHTEKYSAVLLAATDDINARTESNRRKRTVLKEHL